MSHVFELPSELTIFSAAETRTALLDWLARQPGEPDPPLELSAQYVIDLDGAGVQLLCALSALLSQKGWAWRLVSPSSTLVRACEKLGLSEWLDHHSAREPA